MIQLYPVFYIATLTSRGHHRGQNPLKLCTYRPKYDLCKYNFTVGVINLWNSLPTHVITAVSVDIALRIGSTFRLQGQLIWQPFCKMLLNLSLRFCYYALYCKMRAQRPQAYAHSWHFCTFMFYVYVFLLHIA